MAVAASREDDSSEASSSFSGYYQQDDDVAQRQPDLVERFRGILSGDLHWMDEYSISGFPQHKLAELKQALVVDGMLSGKETIHLPLSNIPMQIIPDLRCMLKTSPSLHTVCFRGFRYSAKMDLKSIQLFLESLAARHKKHSPPPSLKFYGSPSSTVDESSAVIWRDSMASTLSKFDSIQWVHVCCENTEFAKFWMESLAQSQTRVTELSLHYHGVSRFDGSFCAVFDKAVSSLAVSTLTLSGSLGAHAALLPVLARRKNRSLSDFTLNVYLNNPEERKSRGIRAGLMPRLCEQVSQHVQRICRRQTEDEWSTLASVIRGNSTIQTLHIDGKGLSYPTGFVTTLRRLLSGNHTLRALGLRNMNLINATGVDEVLHENEGLEKLKLEWIQMDPVQTNALLQSVKQLQSLRELFIDLRWTDAAPRLALA